MRAIKNAFFKLAFGHRIQFVRSVCLYCVEGELPSEMLDWMEDNDTEFAEEESVGRFPLSFSPYHKYIHTHTHRNTNWCTQQYTRNSAINSRARLRIS